jgi:hypothetical protein
MKSLKIKEFENKKVIDVFKNNKDLFKPYIEFFEKYEEYSKIKNDLPGLMKNNNLTIKQFLSKLSIYTTLPQNQLVNKDSEQISDTKFN